LQIKTKSNAIENNGLYGYSAEYEYPESTVTLTARGTLGYAIPKFEKFNEIIRLIFYFTKRKMRSS
jgi:hypothetical protein